MGATLGLPLLPLFLEHRGGTPRVIGLIMAAFFVAGVATQFALGHVVDRFGRRPVLVVGLVVYGLASMTFLLPVAAPWFALTRAVQGATAGAIEVASLSAVAALFPQEERGRAISRDLRRPAARHRHRAGGRGRGLGARPGRRLRRDRGPQPGRRGGERAHRRSARPTRPRARCRGCAGRVA